MCASKRPPLRVSASDSSSSSAREVEITEIKLPVRQTRRDKPTILYKLSDTRIPRSGSNSGESSPEVFTPPPLPSISKPVTPGSSQSRLLPTLPRKTSTSVASQTDEDAAEAAAVALAAAAAALAAQQQQEAINRAMADAAPPPPVQISGDGALLPVPFEGKATQDADEWLSYFKLYSEYKTISGKKAQVELFKLLMRGQARDWLVGLEDTTDTFDQCQAAFTKRYRGNDIVKFRNARDMYSRRQELNESCDDYVTAMRQMARRISDAPNEEMLRFAILNGLQPNIANFVVAKAPKNIAELLEAGRIAELTTAPENNSGLMLKLSTLQAEMERIGKRLDRQTTAFIESERRSPVRDKHVTFSPTSSMGATNANTSPTAPRRDYDRRPPRQMPQQQRQQPQQRFRQQGNSFYNRNQLAANGPSANQGCCTRCGYSHAGFRCPAEGKTCIRCGLKNHFIKCCRAAARDNRGPRQ